MHVSLSVNYYISFIHRRADPWPMSALVHSLNPGALSKSCYVFHFTDSTLTSCILHYSKSQVSARRGRPALVPFTSDASLNLELGPTDHLPIPIFSLECGILTERKQKSRCSVV